MASKGKAAKPAQTEQDYDPIVAQTQRELKQQGFFPYEVDGRAGQKTSDAIKARDAKKSADDAAANETERLRQSGKKIDADTAATKVDTERKQRYSDQSASGEGISAKVAANSLAPLAGTYLGWKTGAKLNSKMGSSQASKNNVLSGVADDRVKGLTTLEGARQGAKLSGAMPLSNPLLRSASRMAPHAIIGGLGMAKGADLLLGDGQPQEYYPEQVDRAFGLGYVGAGGAMIKQGVSNVFNPEVAADAKAIAVINSNGLKRNALMPAAPATPAPAVQSAPPSVAQPVQASPAAQAQAEKMRHGQRLANAVTATGGKPGVSKASSYQSLAKNLTAENSDAVAKALNLPSGTAKGEILQRARELMNTKGLSSLAGPGIAAAIAYAASPDDANAADGTGTGGGRTEALTNAGVVGGIAYGIQKALPAGVGKALSMTSDASAPAVIDAMTDDFASPEARNWAARNFPEALQFGAVADARDMATVPEPNPERAAQEAPMADDGDFETQMAELQQMLSELGTDDDEPAQQAVASQSVAQRPMPSQQDWGQAYQQPQNRLMATR